MTGRARADDSAGDSRRVGRCRAILASQYEPAGPPRCTMPHIGAFSEILVLAQTLLFTVPCVWQVSLNGEIYSQDAVGFVFYPTPLPIAIVPSVAPSSGGVTITVSGLLFYTGAAADKVECRSVAVRARTSACSARFLFCFLFRSLRFASLFSCVQLCC